VQYCSYKPQLSFLADTNMTIDRASGIIERETFEQMMHSTLLQPWLVRKSGAFFDVLELCESEAEKDLVLKLISKIHFSTPNDQLNYRREIAKFVTGTLKLSEANTIFLALNDTELADSSSAFVQQMKGVLAEIGGWRTPAFVDKLSSAVSRAKQDSAIVVVDDFSGSGGSISGKIAWLRKELAKAKISCKIFVVVASAMERSKLEIEPLVDQYHAVNWLSRGLSDLLVGHELEQAKEVMIKLESKLQKKSSGKQLADYTFGWRKSETLYYLEGDNPPNNNFPLLWWPKLKGGVRRDPLLPRI
jgi:hypothetical protein